MFGWRGCKGDGQLVRAFFAMWPWHSQYIFSLLLYVAKNKNLFTKNLEFHDHDIRSANIFHLHFTKLIKYQKEAQCAGIKIFNNFPTHIKCVVNEILILKLALKRFLSSN